MGVVTITKKGHVIKRSSVFDEKNRVTPSVTAWGDTNLVTPLTGKFIWQDVRCILTAPCHTF